MINKLQNSDILNAVNTIDCEIEAIEELKNNLDDSLTAALDLIEQAKGRIILTGMGKSGHIAKKIAEKLKKRHQRLNEIAKPNKVAIISRYVSILAVGEQKDINSFMQYTVYQLFDEFKRYELKLNWDIYLQAKMAGAKDLKEVDDWMKDIHSEE